MSIPSQKRYLTDAERVEQRALSNARFAHVNKALRALYAERKQIKKQLEERENEST